jgi:hypothetical protein
MVNLEKILKEKIAKVEVRMANAAEERDESSTPNESNHKLTRQISDQLFNTLTDEKHSLRLILPKIKNFKNIYQVIKTGGNATTNYMIVPDGLGGILVEGTLLVGVSSPIGEILKTKSMGDEYEFNGTAYTVQNIFENK